MNLLLSSLYGIIVLWLTGIPGPQYKLILPLDSLTCGDERACAFASTGIIKGCVQRDQVHNGYYS